jgi:hypothetical protein
MRGTVELVLALGCACACSREPPPTDAARALEILAAHHAADIDPEGAWIDYEESGAWILFVARQPESSRWTVRSEFLQPVRPGTPLPAPEVFETTAVGSDGVLSLDVPLRGSSRLHPCRFGREEFLLPEVGVRFEGASVSGRVYRRMAPREESIDFPGTVEEPIPAGTWEAVDGPEWAWLEIRQTGVEGRHWLRCSRRRAGDVDNDYSLAIWRGDVMELDWPLFGSSAWSLRRAGEEYWLVPAVPGEHPSGIRFRLVNHVSRSVGPLIPLF